MQQSFLVVNWTNAEDTSFHSLILPGATILLPNTPFTYPHHLGVPSLCLALHCNDDNACFRSVDDLVWLVNWTIAKDTSFCSLILNHASHFLLPDIPFTYRISRRFDPTKCTSLTPRKHKRGYQKIEKRTDFRPHAHQIARNLKDGISFWWWWLFSQNVNNHTQQATLSFYASPKKLNSYPRGFENSL